MSQRLGDAQVLCNRKTQVVLLESSLTKMSWFQVFTHEIEKNNHLYRCRWLLLILVLCRLRGDDNTSVFFFERANPIGFLQPNVLFEAGFRGRRILRPTDMIQNLMHFLQGLAMLGNIAWHMSFFNCGEYRTHEDISKTRFANSQRNWFGFWNNYINYCDYYHYY